MEGPTSDDNSDFAPDDAFSMICGDLGLGETSRSSAALRYELEILSDVDPWKSGPGKDVLKSQTCVTKNGNESEQQGKSSKSRSASVEEQNEEPKSLTNSQATTKKKLLNTKKSKPSKTKSVGDAESESSEDFPMYADVPYGTSLRQQKKLFEQNLGSIKKKLSVNSESDVLRDEVGKKHLSSEEIDRRLLSAVEEVEELKQDLEICRQRLEAKYHAITILKKQAEENNHEHITNELRAKEASLKLAEEVNKLQFELQWKESSFMDSQQTWAHRFDRMCQENALLSSQLEARSEEFRRANNHRMALRRERDELLALLDIKERTRYEQSHGKSADEEFEEYSTTELAVLGACRCREPHGTEPCGCAYAAANLTREIYRLREEGKMILQRRDEAYKTVDAYRLAFEEQLEKTRLMTQELAAMATVTSRSVKAKAAVRFLLSVLADDDFPPRKKSNGGPTEVHSVESLQALTLPQLVTLLTEMLHEKKEALVHQKLAGQVLSARLQEMERKLKSMCEADGDVFHN